MDPRMIVFNHTILHEPVWVVKAIRRGLDSCFSEETAYPGSWDPKLPSKGHCAAVAICVQRLLGGGLVSTKVNGESHWFNRINIPERIGGYIDVDLTADQFGYEPVRVGEAGELYPEITRDRHPSEVKPETIDRADILFARLTK